jgi:hypothetical protein
VRVRVRRRLLPITAVAVLLCSCAPYQAGAPAAENQQTPGAHARQSDEHDNPAAREEWFRAGRESETQTPAAQLRHNAVRQKVEAERAIRLTGRVSTVTGQTVSVAQWQELGPRPQNHPQYGNVAGRVTAIAADLVKDPSGNTVYVGTAYGGLWRSTNALSTNPSFVPLTESAATLAIGAIAIDATTTPSTIYVGTGEPDSSIDSYYGVGVMKSVDDGLSWAVVSIADGGNEALYGLSFSKLLVDETYPQVLIGCTRLAGIATFRNLLPGIYRSTDRGATWTLVYTSPYGCSDLVYQRATKTYFAAIRGQGLLASKTAGAGWSAVGSPIVSGAKASINNLKRIALAERGNELWTLMIDANGNLSTPVPCPSGLGPCDTGLSLSLDGGLTFTAMPAPPNAFGASSQGWYDVYFGTPGATGTVVLGGIDVWSGTYNGSTAISWSNLTNAYSGGSVHADQHAFLGLDESHWIIGNDGGVWTTKDAGGSWTNANGTMGAIQFTSASADPQIAGQYFGGSQDNGTALMVASSSNWGTIYNGDGGYTLASTQMPGRYLTENYGISLRRSDNRGQLFQTVVDRNTILDNSAFYPPYVFADSSEASLLFGTCRLWRGPVAASNGAGWMPISNDLTGTMCGSYITAIAVAPASPDVVYVATRNGFLWQTTKGSALVPSWTQINLAPVPLRPMSALAVDPNDPTNVYVTVQGFDTGHVYRRVNGTWVDISGNLPNVPANSIVVDPQQPLNLYLATDTGVYMTSDGGTLQSQWQLLGTGLPNVAVVEIKIVPGNPRLLLAATHGRGAWTIPIETFQTPAPPPTVAPPRPAARPVHSGNSPNQ